MDRSRFVVLKHTQSANQIPLYRRQHLADDDLTLLNQDFHYDLMLESASGLLTWAMAKTPNANCPRLPAIALPLHREVYLDFEGAISENRGTVERVMAGTFKLLAVEPPVSLEDRFEKLTVELFPNNAQPLQLMLERLEQDKFQLIRLP